MKNKPHATKKWREERSYFEVRWLALGRVTGSIWRNMDDPKDIEKAKKDIKYAIQLLQELEGHCDNPKREPLGRIYLDELSKQYPDR